MLIRRTESGLLIRTPAKVNLFLEVLHKRPDGYHELATLMLAVTWCDSLELAPGADATVGLECDAADLSTGPDNLVVKAAALLQQRCGAARGAAIRLRKRIPMAAGLAGGSSDAAAALVGLNLLWDLRLTTAELIELATQLGSDVPFFLAGPAAWCTGRGERVEPLTLGRPLDLVLACPPVGLSTARVFGQLQVPDQPVDGTALRQAVTAGDVEAIARRLHNRLQATAESICPEVAQLRHHLADLGPAGQLMTGSGSTMFALCRDRAEALRVARELSLVREERAGFRVCVVRSCT
jgi:4-diphosphocytidyl-2-C-methyl-D-erythritol kinase